MYRHRQTHASTAALQRGGDARILADRRFATRNSTLRDAPVAVTRWRRCRPKNTLADGRDPQHDEGECDHDAAKAHAQLAPVRGDMLADEEAGVRRDRGEHHQNEVTGHCVGEHPSHEKRNADYYLKIEQAGEYRGETASDTRRAAGRDAERESEHGGERDKQDQVPKPGVDVVENVHALQPVETRLTRAGPELVVSPGAWPLRGRPAPGRHGARRDTHRLIRACIDGRHSARS